MAETKPDEVAAGEASPPASPEAQWSTGRDTIEYDEYPDFKENMISEAFIKRMVGHFNNEDPETAFEGWTVIAQSKPKPKDNIKYTMGKKQVEGMPTIEIMGYAEFEGVSAAVSPAYLVSYNLFGALCASPVSVCCRLAGKQWRTTEYVWIGITTWMSFTPSRN